MCAHTPAHTRGRRYLEDFTPRFGDFGSSSTRGAISVHINSNEHTDSRTAQNWIDFDTAWCAHARASVCVCVS